MNRRWRFNGGSSIDFGHCQNEEDVHNYDSAQYQLVIIEQAEQFLPSMYLHFFSIIRTTNPLIKPKFRCTFNPGGVGHSFLVDRFGIGVMEPNKIHEITDEIVYPDGRKEKVSYGRAFIPATVFENEHIMKNDKPYVARLMSLAEPYKSAYLYGKFDVFEGQFFKEWDPLVHVVEPFDIPENWARYISFDWGYGGGKTAMYWWAQDPGSRTWFIYREVYVSGMSDVDVALEMDSLSKSENIHCVYYPWDLDNKQPTANFISMRERMDDATGRKFYWKKANNDRKQGWMALRHLLKVRPNGEPMMKVFSCCRNFIRTIPQQIFDDSNSEDLDTMGEDHAVDGARYFAASHMPFSSLEEESAKDDKVDVGGAYLIPERRVGDKTTPRQFVMKKKPELSMNWLMDY